MKNNMHTPTPWEIEKNNEHTPHTIIFSDATDFSIAEAYGEDNTEAEANAEFIVKACNAYEDLLNTLRQMDCTCIEPCDAVGIGYDWHKEENENCNKNMAKKAIAKAEGE